jgi:hypothetical protein
MKGIIYSVIASLLLIPVIGLVLFSFNSIEKNIDSNIRSNELEYFSMSLEDDMSRFMKIAGKRALISAVSKIVTDGSPLLDAQANITEMIMYGTLDGVIAPLIDANNLNVWKDNVTNIAREFGFYLEFQNMTTEVTQNDSFNVLLIERVVMNISDPSLKMGIAKNLTVSTAIPIDGIEDPLFPLRTYSRVIRIIRTSNTTNLTSYLAQGTLSSGSISGNATFSFASPSMQKIFVTSNMSQAVGTLNQFGGIVSESTYVPPGLTRPYIAGAASALAKIQDNERIYLDSPTKKVWDLANLTYFIKNKFYRSSASGPSLLDRMEGRLNLSSKYKHGMETVINLEDELEAYELYPLINEQATCIDYLYWNGTLGSPVRNGNYDQIFDWFKIDPSNKAYYGVSELA